MKRLTLILFLLLLASCVPLPAQLVKFLNFSDTTKIVNGDIYTVRYELDSILAQKAKYLIFTMTAPGSRYQVHAWQCYAPPFPNCAKEFPVYISANDGQRLQLLASSQLSETRGILDRSGLITVVPRTTGVPSRETETIGVFPNPAHEYATVRYVSENGRPYSLSIITVQGEEIYRYSAKQGGGTQTVSFDTRPLPSGTYFLLADNTRTSETITFVIQH